MNIIPNLFDIATSELSQDAFITWLIKWSDESLMSEDRNLHETAKDLVLSILKCGKIKVPQSISKINAGRQWGNIDIWIDIDEKYFVVIEDKKDACQHGKQLEKYKKFVHDHFKKSREIVLIYFKTGNESLSTIQNIQENGWYYFNRKDFLNVLRQSNSDNNILLEFRRYLEKIEENTLSFHDSKNLDNGKATEGLYLWLQNELEDWSDWNYVSNPNGGFLGFWYNFVPCSDNAKRELYLQIENYVGNKINLYIRICGEWNKTTNYLYKVYDLIKEKSKGKEIEITKPSRFKPGAYSSIAMIKNVFKTDQNGKLDLSFLMKSLKISEKIIEEVAKEI